MPATTKPGTAELAGNYRIESALGSSEGMPTVGTLRLNADGTFAGTQCSDLLAGVNADARIDGTGRWTMDDSTTPIRLLLRWDQPARLSGMEARLVIHGSRRPFHLHLGGVDVDEHDGLWLAPAN